MANEAPTLATLFTKVCTWHPKCPSSRGEERKVGCKILGCTCICMGLCLGVVSLVSVNFVSLVIPKLCDPA